MYSLNSLYIQRVPSYPWIINNDLWWPHLYTLHHLWFIPVYLDVCHTHLLFRDTLNITLSRCAHLYHSISVSLYVSLYISLYLSLSLGPPVCINIPLTYTNPSWTLASLKRIAIDLWPSFINAITRADITYTLPDTDTHTYIPIAPINGQWYGV